MLLALVVGLAMPVTPVDAGSPSGPVDAPDIETTPSPRTGR